MNETPNTGPNLVPYTSPPAVGLGCVVFPFRSGEHKIFFFKNQAQAPVLERALFLKWVFRFSWLSGLFWGFGLCKLLSGRRAPEQTAKPSPRTQGDSTKTSKPNRLPEPKTIFHLSDVRRTCRRPSRKSAARHLRNSAAQPSYTQRYPARTANLQSKKFTTQYPYL